MLSAAQADDCRPGGEPGGPTWGVERGQLAGPGMLRAPAPAIRRLVLVDLRLLARPVFGARHSHSPGQPGALCWRRRRRRRQLWGRGIAAISRRPMTAQSRRGCGGGGGLARPRVTANRGPRRGHVSQSATSEPQPTAARGGQVRSWRSWVRKLWGGGASVPVTLCLRLRLRPGRQPHGNSGSVVAHLGLGLLTGAKGRGLAPADPEAGVSSARTAKRLLCARNSSGGRLGGAGEPGLGGHFEQCPWLGPIHTGPTSEPYRVQRLRGPSVYPYCVTARAVCPGAPVLLRERTVD